MNECKFENSTQLVTSTLINYGNIWNDRAICEEEFEGWMTDYEFNCAKKGMAFFSARFKDKIFKNKIKFRFISEEE